MQNSDEHPLRMGWKKYGLILARGKELRKKPKLTAIDLPEIIVPLKEKVV